MRIRSLGTIHPMASLLCRSETEVGGLGDRVFESLFTRSRESAWRFHQGNRKAADL